MTWRLVVHMNGISLSAFGGILPPFVVEHIKREMHRSHALGKPFIKGWAG